MRTLYLWLLIFIVVSCNTTNPISNDTSEPSVIKLEYITGESVPIEQLVDLEYALSLGLVNDTPVSSPSKVIEDPHSSSLFILETNANEGIHVFSSEGTYLYNIGSRGEGPGEYIQINDFGINDSYILLGTTTKLILFNIDGRFLLEKNINDFIPSNVVSRVLDVRPFKNQFIVRFNLVTGIKDVDDVFIIGFDFNVIDSFNAYDPRVEVLPFGSGNKITVNQSHQIGIAESFGMTLRIYEPNGSVLKTYVGWHSQIDFELAKKEINQRDMRTVFPFLEQANTPVFLHSYQNKFVAFTVNHKNKSSRFVVIDPVKDTIKAFPATQEHQETQTSPLIKSATAVSSERMVVVFNDCDDWMAFKQTFTNLNVIGREDAECPDLVFFRWKENAFD